MKKTSFALSFILILVVCFSLLLTGCNSKDDGSNDGKTYIMMYSDGKETHKLQIKYGEVYSIPQPLPSKEGSEFLGLYDAEVGGTQYVTASGVSVSAFYDKKNIVLYPQFSDNVYTLMLNYGEAESVTASVVAEYNGGIPMLPSYLTVPNKDYMIFKGWYTKPSGSGTKISGADGVPLVVTKQLLGLSYKDGDAITLYAYFQLQKYTVTFYSSDGKTKLETVSAEHGTELSKIGSGINHNGRAVLKWSSSMGGAEFNGQITRDTSLYALTYATLTTSFNVNNCIDNNGYNPIKQAVQADDRARHNGYEVVKLSVTDTEKLSDGTYRLTSGQPPKLSLAVLQNLGRLPINNEGSASIKEICSDSFNGSVYGTNINKQTIGYGAYYVKVTYTDSSTAEKSATNILNGKTRGDFVDIDFPFDVSKTIQKIEVIVVYEIHTKGKALGEWNEFSNWRCSALLRFN